MSKDVNLSEKVKILMDMIEKWEGADLGDKARTELRKKYHNDNNRDNDSFDDKYIKALNDDEAWEELQKEILIPCGVQTIPAGEYWIKENGFAYERHMFRKVIIPSTVTRIGENAFRLCRNLEEVIFKDMNSKVVIEQGAFSSCNSLKKIKFPSNTVFEIKHSNFWSILAGTAVDQIDFYDTFQFENSKSSIKCIIQSNSEKESLFIKGIPSNLKINFMTNTIPETMFEDSHLGDFQNWKNFDRIQEVGDRAFYVYESQLRRGIEFTPKNKNGDLMNIIPPNVRKIGKEAYKNRELPANIKLPKTLEEIGEGAFINTKIKLISCTSWQAKVLRANHAIDDDVEIQIDDESSLKQETLEKRIVVNPRMNNIVITCDDINVKDKRVVAIRLECDDPNMIASISKINGNDIHINILSVAEQSVEVEIKIFITYCE